jgi:hypothetical protein
LHGSIIPDHLSPITQIFELITGSDYLFDPASGSCYGKDDDHIAQIMELIGKVLKSIAFWGKYSSGFFNPKGQLVVHLCLHPLISYARRIVPY